MRTKLVAIVFFCALLFSACEKEIINEGKIHSDASTVQSIDGVLHFDSHEHYMEVMEYHKTLTKSEFDTWAKRNNFVPYLSLVEKIYRDLNDAQTAEHFMDILASNSDIMEDVNDMIMPIVSLPIYQRLMNRDGNYFIDGVAYRVCRDEIFSTEEGCLEILNSGNLDDSGYLQSNNINVFRYKGGIYEKSSCATGAISQEKLNNNNKRKIVVEIIPNFLEFQSTDYPGYKECYYCVTVQTHTWRKPWIGKMIRYENPHSIRDLIVKMYTPHTENSIYYAGKPNFFANNQITMTAASTSTDVQTKIWCDNQQIGARVLYQQNSTPPDNINQPRINTANVKAWSQGVPESEKLIMEYTCYFNPI